MESSAQYLERQASAGRETGHPIAAPNAESELLIQAQCYLRQREKGLYPGPALEAAWTTFYDAYSCRIHKYAFACGATEEDIADCVQEVWTELLVRLPTFRFDPNRGKFDTWLYHIVQGKTVNLHRSHKHRYLQEKSDTLQTLIDDHPSPATTLEDVEMLTLAWDQLKKRLSECNLQVLQMRLVEQRPVAEVAAELGLSNEQVWYRCHRVRHQVMQIGSTLARGQPPPCSHVAQPHEKKVKGQQFAQAKAACSVSRIASPNSFASQGGSCVDYVFQRLELGRRELSPEWKVEWNCDAVPRSVLYIRKMAIVAYAEICCPGDCINANWPRIVHAAIAAGVAAGIATIIATPTAALPVFQTEFYKQLQGKGGSAMDEKIQVALSAKQEANGPWCVCKD